ncbi:hypothetical protein [Rarobacter incanus]|nr:hypothetical protein [Rarobacter incanus]
MADRNNTPENSSEQEDWPLIPIDEDGGEAPPSADTELALRVEWTLTHGQLKPSSITLVNTRGGAVTPEQWRHIKIGELVQASRYLLAAAGHLWQLSTDDATAHLHAKQLIDLAEPKSTSRSGYPDAHYREVAEIYSGAARTQDTQPVKAVRREMRQRYPNLYSQLKETTVKGWIRTAKAKGYIAQTARQQRANDTKGTQQ